MDLGRKNIVPENFKDRIIFMSMFNDIEWKKKDDNCISNAEKVKNSSNRFQPGHWTFPSGSVDIFTEPSIGKLDYSE